MENVVDTFHSLSCIHMAKWLALSGVQTVLSPHQFHSPILGPATMLAQRFCYITGYKQPPPTPQTALTCCLISLLNTILAHLGPHGITGYI